jgi:hypothetical protein
VLSNKPHLRGLGPSSTKKAFAATAAAISPVKAHFAKAPPPPKRWMDASALIDSISSLFCRGGGGGPRKLYSENEMMPIDGVGQLLGSLIKFEYLIDLADCTMEMIVCHARM